MAGRYKKVSKRKGINEVLGVIVMSLRVSRLLAEIARLYSLWKESGGGGQNDGADDPGPEVSQDGGDIPSGDDMPGAGVESGFDFGGFDSFGGF